MDRDTAFWTRPKLSEIEACAIVAAIGRPRSEWGLRTSVRAQQWLHARFPQPEVTLEGITEALDRALDEGPDAVSEVAFRPGAMEVIVRALFNAMTEAAHDNVTTFVARFGVDRTRAEHLRTAMNLEWAIARAQHTSPDLTVADEMEERLELARGLRTDRGAVCGDLDLTTAPELRLLGDVYRMSRGQTNLVYPTLDDAVVAFSATTVDALVVAR